MARLQIIGGGRMGEALVGGLVASGWAQAADLVVVEALEARREDLRHRFPDLCVSEVPVPADGTVVAVKPADVPAVCRELAAVGPARVLSIAAGVTLAVIEEALGPGVAVVRAMPNTPALVREGAAAVAGGRDADEDDLAWAEEILRSVGVVVRVPESLLDAVTGLSGSGPAYVFLVAETLIEAGVLSGLPRDTAEILATQTLVGSARLLIEGNESPSALRAAVTSPGGTTAAGLRELEDRGVRAAILAAVDAAARRSRELGER